MTAGASPVRRIHNEYDLQDLVEAMDRDAALIERDFALMTIAAGLAAAYGDSLCFKGGFVLRHVHGHERFSSDIDATRINPPRNKLAVSREREARVVAELAVDVPQTPENCTIPPNPPVWRTFQVAGESGRWS